MSDTHCDECGREFHGHGDHRGRWHVVYDPPAEKYRFCSSTCLAKFANRRAEQSEREE